MENSFWKKPWTCRKTDCVTIVAKLVIIYSSLPQIGNEKSQLMYEMRNKKCKKRHPAHKTDFVTHKAYVIRHTAGVYRDETGDSITQIR